MRGKGVVVTGGGSGLGKAVSLHLAAEGWAVAVLDVNGPAAERVAAEIEAHSGRAVAVCGDITGRQNAAALFGQAVERLGAIGGLVNCAGIYPRKPILEITDEDWNLNFAVNVRGTYNMMVVAVAHLRGLGGGRIVNVASVDAFKAHPANAHYAAMKAAVVSLTRSFGLECAPLGILVNGVAPAAIATEKAKAAGFLPELAAQAPIGRAAAPEDIAEVISFLLSDRNRYLVGETVIASGGYIFA